MRRFAYLVLVLNFFVPVVHTAVIAPPWTDTQVNPCAQTSWQLLFWPDDGQCYPIFQQGPCPPTQELAFDPEAQTPHCRCPKHMIYWEQDGRCYRPHSQGPCERDQYLHPSTSTNNLRRNNLPLRLARQSPASNLPTCRLRRQCPLGSNYWPADDRCYQLYTLGPCPKGDLFVVDPETGLPHCGCNSATLYRFYWPHTGSCYEPHTRGPCELGLVFLYNHTLRSTQCTCQPHLATFHLETGKCYGMFSRGPCSQGQWFASSNTNIRHSVKESRSISIDSSPFQLTEEDVKLLHKDRFNCMCLPDHVYWTENGNCYRPYTRGPCGSGAFLIPNVTITGTGTCVKNPCARGQLYFPNSKKCFRVGTRGPCDYGQVVVYEDIHGISYRGECGCSRSYVQNYWPLTNQCYELGTRGPCQDTFTFLGNRGGSNASTMSTCRCNEGDGYVFWNATQKCYKLFTQGPCEWNEWLVFRPIAHQTVTDSELELSTHATEASIPMCQCKPGYEYEPNSQTCRPPTMELLLMLQNQPRPTRSSLSRKKPARG